jgi:hypothetical protein
MLGQQRNALFTSLPKARAQRKKRNGGTAPLHNDVGQAFIALLEKHVSIALLEKHVSNSVRDVFG